MRIWSKKLIHVLPNKQLKAMRYELGDMIKQHPNIKHPLVKFANNYDITYLGSYFLNVCKELRNRNINMNDKYNTEIITIILKDKKVILDDFDFTFKRILNHLLDPTFDEDNTDYLQICWWNLYEKHLRKMITDEEWEKIDKELSYLWYDD